MASEGAVWQWEVSTLRCSGVMLASSSSSATAALARSSAFSKAVLDLSAMNAFSNSAAVTVPSLSASQAFMISSAISGVDASPLFSSPAMSSALYRQCQHIR